MDKSVVITAEHVEALASAYLSPSYDHPHPFGEFHRECWGWYCDPALQDVAVAAPRYHGKSIALTDAYIITSLGLRFRRYCILFSASEDLAIQHLARISDAFKFNDALRADLRVDELTTDAKTDIIVRFKDGWDCRVTARGSGQKIRGLNWKGMRPDLLLGDDLESDDDVTTSEIRRAFRRWFMRVAKQLLGEGGITRIHGTILHDDSLLRNLCNSWPGKVYKAHASFSDFSQILWPARFNEEELRRIQAGFVKMNDAAGYAQELLNSPRDRDDPYLSKDWFRAMPESERETPRVYGVGVDFAISQADSANRTAFVVGGKDWSGMETVVDVRKGRWDATKILDTFFDIHDRWHPAAFFPERGAIWSALEPALRAEMRRRDKYLTILPQLPIKDKASRGRPLQARMRSGGMQFDKEAEWYPEYESEMLLFTAEAGALADDQFDATTWMELGLQQLQDVEQDDDLTDDDQEWLARGDALRGGDGRSEVTGY